MSHMDTIPITVAKTPKMKSNFVSRSIVGRVEWEGTFRSACLYGLQSDECHDE